MIHFRHARTYVLQILNLLTYTTVLKNNESIHNVTKYSVAALSRKQFARSDNKFTVYVCNAINENTNDDVIWDHSRTAFSLPSLFMSTCRHLLRRQARHWLRCVLSMGHWPRAEPWALHVYSRRLWTLRLKKPEQPIDRNNEHSLTAVFRLFKLVLTLFYFNITHTVELNDDDGDLQHVGLVPKSSV